MGYWEVPAGCYSVGVEVIHGRLTSPDLVIEAIGNNSAKRTLVVSPGQLIEFEYYGDVGRVLLDWTEKEHRQITEPFEISYREEK